MNSDIFEGKWKQLKGKVKSHWGKLTDVDVDVVEGRYSHLWCMRGKEGGVSC